MTYISDNDKWRAITTRDTAADGLFVYAVRTTRIYCRPNCKARVARRANVGYYPDYRAAEAGGFRACKRCKPRTEGGMPEDEAVARIRALVGKKEELAALAAAGVVESGEGTAVGRPGESPSTLASQARVSRWHFHRKFKEVTGQTPRAYLKQRERERKAREAAAAAAAGGQAVADGKSSQTTSTTTPSTKGDDLLELADGTPMPDLSLLLEEVESNPGQFDFDSFHNSPLDTVDMDALCASGGMDPLFLDPALWGDLTGGSGSGSGSGSVSGSSVGGAHGDMPGYYMDGSLFEAVPTTEATTATRTSTTNDTIPYTGT